MAVSVLFVYRKIVRPTPDTEVVTGSPISPFGVP